MDNVYHFLCKLRHFPSLESLEIFKFFRRDPISVVHISLINDKLRAELISHFLLKLFQDIGTHRSGISEPVYIFFPCHLIKDQCELVKKCSKSYYIHIIMGIQKSAEAIHGMCTCCRLTHIKSDLRFYIFPVIDNCIVHMHRIPHDICKKAYRILMELFRRADHNISFIFIV